MKKESVKALFEAKKEFGKLLKNKENPFHKSKYADLNALLDTISEPLERHGFFILQPILNRQVVTQIIEFETGEVAFESIMEISNQTDPQKIGSEITYFRRYTLQSLLGISAEDDDGNQKRAQPGKNDHKKNNQEKVLTEAQFKKLKLPENQKYIDNYLANFTITEAWRKELEIINKNYKENAGKR